MEITVINEQNRSYFESLMPESLWQQADLILGAIDGGAACGILAAAEADTILEILYLYVAEPHRRRGAATELLEGLHQLGQDSRMDGEVCQYTIDATSEELDRCLSRNLFLMDDWKSTVYITDLKDVSAKYFESNLSEAEWQKLMPIGKVTAKTWNQFLEKAGQIPEEDGAAVNLGARGLYDPEASFLLISNGLPQGGILFEKQEKDYILSCFCTFGTASPMDMMTLFRAGYRVLKERSGGETKIYINALTQTSEKMILQLTEQKAKPVGQAVTRYYFY